MDFINFIVFALFIFLLFGFALFVIYVFYLAFVDIIVPPYIEYKRRRAHSRMPGRAKWAWAKIHAAEEIKRQTTKNL